MRGAYVSDSVGNRGRGGLVSDRGTIAMRNFSDCLKDWMLYGKS